MRVVPLIVMPIMALTALFLISALAQPVQIGGDYGKAWLDMNGNKNVVQTSSESLWSWGTIPKGQFLENPKPILLNRTMEHIGVYFPPDFSSPYFMNDPWFISQMTGRTVILRQ